MTGEDDRCPGNRQQSPKDFSPRAMITGSLPLCADGNLASITPSLHLSVDDAEHQLQVLCDPRFPAFISSQSRHQLVPAGLGDKDGGGGGVLLDLLP